MPDENERPTSGWSYRKRLEAAILTLIVIFVVVTVWRGAPQPRFDDPSLLMGLYRGTLADWPASGSDTPVTFYLVPRTERGEGRYELRGHLRIGGAEEQSPPLIVLGESPGGPRALLWWRGRVRDLVLEAHRLDDMERGVTWVPDPTWGFEGQVSDADGIVRLTAYHRPTYHGATVGFFNAEATRELTLEGVER